MKWMEIVNENIKKNKEADCTTSSGSVVGQKQMEASSSSLIIIEMMEESRRLPVVFFWSLGAYYDKLSRSQIV